MSVSPAFKSIWANPGNRGKRLKKTFQAFAWQVRKRALRTPRVMRLPNGVLFTAYPRCVVSSALVYADWPEYYELMFLRKALHKGDVLIDVGASVGHISLLLADVVGPENIYAFEPAPVSFERLTANWRINRWPTDGLAQKAVGARPGRVFIEDPDVPLTTNRVSDSAPRSRSAQVEMVRLDDLDHLWKGRRIGLLKIDVEGYEPEVLEGGMSLLKTHRPRHIMFESLSGSLDERGGALLTEARYRVFQLGPDGVPDFLDLSAQNLLAIPEESGTVTDA